MPINWQDGSSGGTPLSAANLNRLAVVADIGTTGTPTGDAVKAAAAAQVTDTTVASALGSSTATAIAGRAELKAAYVPKPSTAEKRIYVSAANGASDGNDGLSWATAKKTIAGALAAATSPARIEVGAGAFNETVAQNWSGYTVVGAGMGLTTVLFSPLGTAVAAITTGDNGSGSSISDMTIQGPGHNALGVKNAGVDGIKVTAPVRMAATYVTGFDAGIILSSANGHTQFRDVAVANCYYGVYVTADGGDSYWTGCNINGNNFANVACRAATSADGGLNGAVFVKGHMGFAPYAIYQEAQGSGSSNWLVNVRFLGCHFEAIGNGVFYTENQTGNLGYVNGLWLQDVGFSWSGTYKIGTRAQSYAAVFQYTAGDIQYEPGSNGFAAGTSGIFYVGNNGATFRGPLGVLSGALVGPSGPILPEGTTQFAQYQGAAISMVQQIGPYMSVPAYPFMFNRVMIAVSGLTTGAAAVTAAFPSAFATGNRFTKSVDSTGAAGITVSSTGITFPAGLSNVAGLIIVEGF